MAAKEIAPGSVVRLKSGGPTMTVGFQPKDGIAVCFWHDTDNKPCTADLPVVALEVLG